MNFKTILLGASLLLATQGAFAVPTSLPPLNFAPWNEAGDATDVLPGQAVAGGTTSINGAITGGNDVDLYSFMWGGGVLTMDTFGTGYDTQLHLFDNGGNGIGENDDAGGTVQSEISLNLAADLYYLGISSFNNDAVDAGNLPIFGFTNTFNDLNGNTIQGPEGNGPLAGWDAQFFNDGGEYTINFSAATADDNGVPMPEPGTLALLGLGLIGVGLARRRRRT